MIALENLPEHSRLWFFQCDRFLTESEHLRVEEGIQTFITDWESHGAKMAAGFALYHKSLLIVALDEAQAPASGCGIDKCFRVVDQLSKTLSINFLSRTTVLFQSKSGMELAPLNQFWAMKKAGLIDLSTLVVDTTIGKLGDLPPSGLKRFDQTWHMEMWSH